MVEAMKMQSVIRSHRVNTQDAELKLLREEVIEEDPTFGMRAYQDRWQDLLIMSAVCWRSEELFFEADDRYRS